MAYSLFDIIGPVMHGPSSNHTGGANRIGYYAQAIMGGQPQNVVLGFHPAYMGSYVGQRSHTALLAGCLGYREFDDESTDSVAICRQRGLEWTAAPIAETERSRNTMRVTGTVDGDTFVVNGDSVGGGNIIIDLVNGLPLRLDGNDFVAVLHSPEEELVRRAGEALIADLGDQLKDFQMGQVLGDKFLGLVVAGREPGQLPAELEDKLHFHIVPPLYSFHDTGAQPLFETFAQLEQLVGEKDICEVAIDYECRRSGVTREKVLDEARFLVKVVHSALNKAEKEDIKLIGGLVDNGDGKKMLAWANSGQTVVNPMFATALARALMLAELNGASCRIVAAPTGGSAGCFPGTLVTAAERYGKDDEVLARAFIVAACVGLIIGNKASFSGTIGGCQSEVGIGSAMGAAAIIWMAGGTYSQIVNGAAIALKNMLGLTCDPPASPVEVPCIKRNAMGVSVAFFGAEMGLAGIRSAIPMDDVIVALADTQQRMPMELKFSHIGGLACTETGKKFNALWKEKLKTLE